MSTQLLYSMLAIAFGLSLSFLIVFKLDLQRDWHLVTLLTVAFISVIYGGVSLVKVFTGGPNGEKHSAECPWKNGSSGAIKSTCQKYWWEKKR